MVIFVLDKFGKGIDNNKLVSSNIQELLDLIRLEFKCFIEEISLEKEFKIERFLNNYC